MDIKISAKRDPPTGIVSDIQNRNTEVRDSREKETAGLPRDRRPSTTRVPPRHNLPTFHSIAEQRKYSYSYFYSTL